MDIPPELAREIVGHLPALDEDNGVSLKAMSLVSSTFSSYSQERLFYSLNINSRKGDPTAGQRIIQRLDHCQLVRKYMRKLSITISDPSLEPSVAEALQHLNRLNIIREVNMDWQSWTYCPSDVPDAIAAILSSATSPIISLRLRRCSAHLADLCTSSLEYLELVQPRTLSIIPPLREQGFVHLKELCLEATSALLAESAVRRLLQSSRNRMSDLRSLRLQIMSVNLDEVKVLHSLATLVLASASSLRALEYTIGLTYSTLLKEEGVFDLSRFTQLREMRLSFQHARYFDQEGEGYHHNTPFKWVLCLLQTVSSAMPLENVELTWDHVPYNEGVQLAPDFDFQIWEELDLLFSDRSRFERLSWVGLHIRVEGSLIHNDPTGEFGRLLKKTMDRGILRLRKTVYPRPA
ncbi:hypothetical protein FA15DRAFT_360422 [Coprinopsis marcescibilis]|uniref:Uncharacterized protein n=1 Tax=Coprinopsis marcescibilis TaxID=230819 RepID=A0A5C3KY53_COPMA|nr:hypothetical protein FA15DRAFT_360422 [Coprinopsis marcescibilis]